MAENRLGTPLTKSTFSVSIAWMDWGNTCKSKAKRKAGHGQ